MFPKGSLFYASFSTFSPCPLLTGLTPIEFPSPTIDCIRRRKFEAAQRFITSASRSAQSKATGHERPTESAKIVAIQDSKSIGIILRSLFTTRWITLAPTSRCFLSWTHSCRDAPETHRPLPWTSRDVATCIRLLIPAAISTPLDAPLASELSALYFSTKKLLMRLKRREVLQFFYFLESYCT